MTVFPKQSKDLSVPQSYRPISLNLILSRALKYYVHNDQTGFMKNRFHWDNIRRIINLIGHVQSSKILSLFFF